MTSKLHLGLGDFVVLGVSLIIPTLIGLYFRFRGGQHANSQHYLLAGKNASMFPVIMSISVTVMSTVLMLGFPAEIYRFGSQYSLKSFSVAVGMYLSSHIFLPVYFRSKVTSIYELLEMRFGKHTRYTISALFIIQNVLYMSAVLLGPALALNAVTDFPMTAMIISFGAVCTFYCVVGGLKAVLWTDVFQAGLMFLCIIILYATAIGDVGSVSEVYTRAKAGDRLQFFDFRFDFETRYTVWNSLLRGISFGLSFYGTSQMEVQRYLSMSGCQRAQKALQWSIIPVTSLDLSYTLFGVVLYAVFYLCDPVSSYEETGINKYDQIVPYFIITRLQSIPGLTGLCVAAIFSGSLSTMSSALNSLATVTIVDFIQPNFSQHLTEKRIVFIAKVLGVAFGVISTGLTFSLARFDSVAQATAVFMSLTEGPVLAIFFIGVLTRKATDRCTMLGLLAGVSIVGWIGFGSLFSGYRYPALQLETSGCPGYNNTLQQGMNASIVCSNVQQCLSKNHTDNSLKEVFGLYKMPYTLISTIGCFVTVISTLIASYLIDGNKDAIPSNSKFLSPVVRYWMKSSPSESGKQEVEETMIQEERIALKINEIQYDFK